jgi:hypothetical protein
MRDEAGLALFPSITAKGAIAPGQGKIHDAAYSLRRLQARGGKMGFGQRMPKSKAPPATPSTSIRSSRRAEQAGAPFWRICASPWSADLGQAAIGHIALVSAEIGRSVR